MSKKPNQKLKLLYLMKIMLEKTDEEHSLTMAEIQTELQRYDIEAERKSLYDDMDALRLYGLDLECRREKGFSYYVASRTFELPELKLLVDAVQSSKFITYRKSNELIKKVESLASAHDAKLLQRQVFVANRVKTMNESIYYNIDRVHAAISSGKKISYQYFEWVVNYSGTEKAKKQYRRNSQRYVISPWALTWDNQNYYMIAYDSEAGKIKHYRVDKMENIALTDELRDGRAFFEKFDMAVYSQQIFGMFGGEAELVSLRFSNRLIGVVLDRFGKDVIIAKADEDRFVVSVKVAVSPQFLSWVFGFGSDVKILSPPHVAEQFLEQARQAVAQYGNEEDDGGIR